MSKRAAEHDLNIELFCKASKDAKTWDTEFEASKISADADKQQLIDKVASLKQQLIDAEAALARVEMAAWKKFLAEWQAGDYSGAEGVGYAEDDETPAQILFRVFMNNGCPKNHWSYVVEVKPEGLANIWEPIEPSQKGGYYDCDQMLDQLFNCGLEVPDIDAYLLELVRMNYGSCNYDW